MKIVDKVLNSEICFLIIIYNSYLKKNKKPLHVLILYYISLNDYDKNLKSLQLTYFICSI